MDTGDLKWDAELAARAQKYAEKLVAETKRTQQRYFKHSDRKGLNIGENLSWRNQKESGTCAEASHAW